MKYPIGIQSFSTIIEDGYIYIDKTDAVYNLASTGCYYFLSRPRRFGKSLLLSTFEAYFKGVRELFDGLAISHLEKNWITYPVLRLDLNARDYKDESSLIAELNRHLETWEKLYGDEFRDRSVEERFLHVIHGAYEKTGQKVVVLIDEYEKPLLQTINNPNLRETYRSTLKSFYGCLKTCDEYIRFAFLTGVTRFGKISVFSDLNNLNDISLDDRYSDICGITDEELHRYLDSSIAALATKNGMSKEDCYARMRRDYDGYRFSINGKGMYNPFSVLRTLDRLQFGEYWFETGTPEFLVRRLQKTNYPLSDLTKQAVSTDNLSNLDVDDDNPLPLLFQSGYLTINDYNARFGTYTLRFPNREVNEGFTKYLYPFYIPKTRSRSNFSIMNFTEDVESGNAESFVKRLVAMFDDGDYQIVGNQEVYFQNTLYVFFKLLGFYVEVERHTSNGRMDALIQTPDYIYIIEIKVGQSAAIALQQIDDKQYAAPFATDHRRLFKIGLNFNPTTRTIDDWGIK